MSHFVGPVDAQAEQHMQDLHRDAELQHLKLLARAGHGTRLGVLRRRRQHGNSSTARRR